MLDLFLSVHPFQAEHAKAREEILGRLKKIATSELTEGHIQVFGEMFNDGELLEGESDFPREGGDGGLKNDWFFAKLKAENAPEPSGRCRLVRDPTCFWTDGPDRLERLTKVFNACVAAGIPLMVEGDAPGMSVMGICAQEAVEQEYVGLGSKGRASGRGPFYVDREVSNKWIAGCVDENCLDGHTWLLRNHEVRLVSKNKNRFAKLLDWQIPEIVSRWSY